MFWFFFVFSCLILYDYLNDCVWLFFVLRWCDFQLRIGLTILNFTTTQYLVCSENCVYRIGQTKNDEFFHIIFTLAIRTTFSRVLNLMLNSHMIDCTHHDNPPTAKLTSKFRRSLNGTQPGGSCCEYEFDKTKRVPLLELHLQIFWALNHQGVNITLAENQGDFLADIPFRTHRVIQYI